MDIAHDGNSDTMQALTRRHLRERPNDTMHDDDARDGTEIRADLCTCGGVGYMTHIAVCPAALDYSPR